MIGNRTKTRTFVSESTKRMLFKAFVNVCLLVIIICLRITIPFLHGIPRTRAVQWWGRSPEKQTERKTETPMETQVFTDFTRFSRNNFAAFLPRRKRFSSLKRNRSNQNRYPRPNSGLNVAQRLVLREHVQTKLDPHRWKTFLDDGPAVCRRYGKCVFVKYRTFYRITTRAHISERIATEDLYGRQW